MTNDVWFWVSCALAVFGLIRELHFRTISRSYSQLLRVMRGVCRQIAELKQLCLDIEQRRKLDQIEQNLKASGTRIDISGGDIRQVGGKIENE